MLRKMIRPVSFFLIFSFMLLDFSVQTAKAQMIDTKTAIVMLKEEADRERVTAFLGREDVQQVMIQHGVDALEAQKRVASLSEAELAKISQGMDQLPAGGNGLGAVVGAVVLIFLVLLITDILGLTNVFSFVKPVR